MKSLTQICESFRLRKEKQRLEEFVDSMGGFTLMCVYGENKKYLPCVCGCSECSEEKSSALPGYGTPTFSQQEQQRIAKFAKNCKDWRYGTTEDVIVDYANGETIKIYTDLVNNSISVKYGPLKTHHKDELGIIFDSVFKKKKPGE